MLSYPREELLEAISKLRRYIVCGRVTKRPIFVFMDASVHPNDALQVFVFEDDYSFGVLQSEIHWRWFVAKCSTLKGDFRYTSNTVFDTFPWPQEPSKKAVRDVANAAKALRDARSKIMRFNNWSLREVYRTLELPGEHSIKKAQGALDDAVRVAYGMHKRDDPLQDLLELNLELAAREKRKEHVVGPGLLPLGGQFSDEYESCVTDDAIAGPAEE